MRLILQRASFSSISINAGEARTLGRGLVILAGVGPDDDEGVADFMAEKAANLRIFEDDGGAMNLSLLDTGGECLTVSNFTLYANCRKGRRPSFTGAAPPEHAARIYSHFVKALERAGISRVEDGEFGAHMNVGVQNDGPVTIILDSAEIMGGQGRPRR